MCRVMEAQCILPGDVQDPGARGGGCGIAFVSESRRRSRDEWRYYSGDNGSTKYSPLDQINKSNVANLKIAWRRPQVDREPAPRRDPVRLLNNFRSTPIMVDGVLYASNGVGLAEAFDPETGKTIWVQQPGVDGVATTDPIRGSANRGVAYWGEGAEARIITFRESLSLRAESENRRADPDLRQRTALSIWARTSARAAPGIAGTRCR